MIMLVLSLLRWWYGDGWRQYGRSIALRLDGVMDYFSIDLLLKTLFQPFRQISTGRVDGPLEVKLRAMADKLISRVIGAMIRVTILLIGLVAIFTQAVLGLLTMALWTIVPLLPVVGVIFMSFGWAL